MLFCCWRFEELLAVKNTMSVICWTTTEWRACIYLEIEVDCYLSLRWHLESWNAFCRLAWDRLLVSIRTRSRFEGIGWIVIFTEKRTRFLSLSWGAGCVISLIEFSPTCRCSSCRSTSEQISPPSFSVSSRGLGRKTTSCRFVASHLCSSSMWIGTEVSTIACCSDMTKEKIFFFFFSSGNFPCIDINQLVNNSKQHYESWFFVLLV